VFICLEQMVQQAVSFWLAKTRIGKANEKYKTNKAKHGRKISSLLNRSGVTSAITTGRATLKKSFLVIMYRYYQHLLTHIDYCCIFSL
jgi:hypothetical protein